MVRHSGVLWKPCHHGQHRFQLLLTYLLNSIPPFSLIGTMYGMAFGDGEKLVAGCCCTNTVASDWCGYCPFAQLRAPVMFQCKCRDPYDSTFGIPISGQLSIGVICEVCYSNSLSSMRKQSEVLRWEKELEVTSLRPRCFSLRTMDKAVDSLEVLFKLLGQPVRCWSVGGVCSKKRKKRCKNCQDDTSH